MIISKTSDKKYVKIVETLHYKPSKEEMFYWYSGTCGGLDPNNPYAIPHRYMTSTKFVEVKE